MNLKSFSTILGARFREIMRNAMTNWASSAFTFLTGLTAGFWLAFLLSDLGAESSIEGTVAGSVHRMIYDDCDSKSCRSIRAAQLILLAKDLQGRTDPIKTTTLRDLPNWFLQHINWDDTNKEIWVEDFSRILAEQFALEFARDALSPEDTVNTDQVVQWLTTMALRYEDA